MEYKGISPNPKISVLTLCYNNGIEVIETIKSVKSQTYSNIEHLILDDCSTNNSYNLIKKWIIDNNYNARLYKNSINFGISKSFNILLNKSSGKLIAINCDDYWDPIHLQTNISSLLENSFDAIFSNISVTDSNLNHIYYIQDHLLKSHYLEADNLLFTNEENCKLLDKDESCEHPFIMAICTL
ncbi:MAG: glycosyltransferase family 2 protein [Saprospiraceae bacterium]|nr:glycosyltransferase family 2 protein [Saprospiraceae bacterium]